MITDAMANYYLTAPNPFIFMFDTIAYGIMALTFVTMGLLSYLTICVWIDE